MSDFDWRFCNPEEYRLGKEALIEPDKLQFDLPYVWMASFDEDSAGRQPVSIEGRAYNKELGLHVVQFATLSSQGEPETGYFRSDGLSTKANEGDLPLYFQTPTGLQARVLEGYFRECRGLTDKDMEKVLSNPARESDRPLVAA